jgi:hypothetical protein
MKRRFLNWLHGYPQYEKGQWVWFRTREWGWQPGLISRPVSPWRTHYYIWMEGDPMRSWTVAVPLIKPWTETPLQKAAKNVQWHLRKNGLFDD